MGIQDYRQWMPGVTIQYGTFSLPETSIQANRSAKVQSKISMDPIAAISGLRQYAIHISGYLSHVAGAPAELEARAFSFDMGTNQNDIVDAVRGMKGRVYADGGKANIRAIYGFAESTLGSGHTGSLTGVLGTCYKNSNLNTDGDSYAIRGHVDSGCNGAFNAAGDTGGATPSFGYSIKVGSGNPLKPAIACYQAHGGGAGDMFLGYATELDLTKTYRVTNAGHVLAPSYYSGTVSIADDAVATITPPAAVGFMKVWFDGGSGGFGEVYFRTSVAAIAKNYGSATFIAQTGDLTGITGVDGNTTVSMGTTGLINIENRSGATRNFNYFFVAK